MLTRRIIPCLDCRDGRVVKGVRFAGLRDAGDPAELAARYEQEGADEVVVLDVSATPEARSNRTETVRAIRAAIGIPLAVGGGVRSVADAAALLAAGADKVGVNTAAVERPELIDELARQFGSQCVVLAVDSARDGERWEVVTRSGTRRTAIDAIEWIVAGARRGAGEILLTSYDRDGTGDGYDLDLLRGAARVTRIPIIASGGAAHARDLVAAFEAGADAALAATIFHDQHTTVGDVKRELAEAGIEVRL